MSLLLVLNPDNSYEMFIDQSKVSNGNLLNDMVPPVNPTKEIDDPNDSKPDDWDERAKIPDPEAVKPDNWWVQPTGIWYFCDSNFVNKHGHVCVSGTKMLQQKLKTLMLWNLRAGWTTNLSLSPIPMLRNQKTGRLKQLITTQTKCADTTVEKRGNAP